MSNKNIALVTGAGKRLGKVIAQGLADSGYAVGLHFNSSAGGAQQLYDQIRADGGEAALLQKDLSQPQHAGQLISETSQALGGPVTLLINSASAFNTDALGDLSLDSWQFLMNVNAAAPVFLMQAFAAQEGLDSGGCIINILDTQMTSPSPERFSYFCSKYALDGATRLAAYDLGPRGIRVNAIAPGLILPSDQTQENFDSRQKLTPLGPGLGPEHVIQAVHYLCEADQVTGHTLVVDAGQRLMGFGNAPIG
ncbi:NAD(P)-dependent dehydrogenase (short-subunit alcohol dehydrogenase family) [Roseibium hamelinense]|uniref:NAD(P)-dependent dehydrogenase (Short-subunit alcohol dehydrogenase family) n=1 Tax=Roseibium hamelinense TaxID=150831 RepID=A0A562SNP0_9HYPH|nr:SDR family oxidoreductase [Roseibium hamelinense]MTI44260.1 SDR family oxidoreductase [Roseibium hamelinense]TWI82967.1 NAD(P)-dependent dehydrogenase (short-subunit alcohol dehydrogenase family) [Roseibium hamelinense]